MGSNSIVQEWIKTTELLAIFSITREETFQVLFEAATTDLPTFNSSYPILMLLFFCLLRNTISVSKRFESSSGPTFCGSKLFVNVISRRQNSVAQTL